MLYFKVESKIILFEKCLDEVKKAFIFVLNRLEFIVISDFSIPVNICL